MSYGLKAGVSFCFAGDRAIFLDRAQDRYFALTPQKEAMFLGLLAGASAEDTEHGRLAELADIGLLAEGESESGITACKIEEAPSSSLWDRQSTTPLLGPVSAAGSLLRAALYLRASTLPRVLSAIEERKMTLSSVGGESDPELYARTAGSFRALGKIVASHNRCLVYSLGIMDHLLRRGALAHLVFGVAARPFIAHCWVQHRDAILSDRLEHVRLFTPILVI